MLGRMSVLNGEVLGIEQSVVHHLEGDARLDQRLVPAERMVLDFLRGARAAVELRGLLRIDQAPRAPAALRCAGIARRR